MPQVVSDVELPSAATLSGLQLNISGIIGPALGGLLVPLAGAKFVFAVNAACFLVVVLATRQWKQPTVLEKLPSESFFHSFWTVIRYVRAAPRLQVVLARNFLFARLSINLAANLEERASGDLSSRVKPKEDVSIALTRKLLAA